MREWNDAIASDPGGRMAVDELEQLAREQYTQARSLAMLALDGMPTDGSSGELSPYDAARAIVARRRLDEALVLTRSALANIDTMRMVARGFDDDAQLPTRVVRLELEVAALGSQLQIALAWTGVAVRAVVS